VGSGIHGVNHEGRTHGLDLAGEFPHVFLYLHQNVELVLFHFYDVASTVRLADSTADVAPYEGDDN